MLPLSPFRAIMRAGALPMTLLLVGGCALFGRSETTLPDHMDQHWNRLDQVQSALFIGDLEGAREPARWLAEHTEHPDLPQGVLSPVEDMRAFGRSVVRSTSVSDAARCAAEMAAACGRCHQAAGSGPWLQQNTMPEAGREARPHMRRHLWAMNRMWEGMAGASDQAWSRGATALAEDPLSLEVGDGGTQEVLALARQVHELGAVARAQPRNDRAGVYARLVVACAQCHSLMGVTATVR